MIQRRPRGSSGKECDNSNKDDDQDLPHLAGNNSNYCGEECIFTDSKRAELPSLLRRFRNIAATQRRNVIVPVISFVVLIISIILTHQIHAYVREYQGPLDHVTTSLWEPYYGLFCPSFSYDEDPGGNSTKGYDDTFSWDCTLNNMKPISAFPRIFMIGARDEYEDTFRSWNQTVHKNVHEDQHQNMPHLERINTLELSNQYALSGGKLRQSTENHNHNLNNSSNDASPRRPNSDEDQKQYLCRKMKWEHRLFSVYQSVFSYLLSAYAKDAGFVIVEDDAVLKNPHAFEKEVCSAHHHELGFYSLYRSPLQRKGKRSSSCIYLHGTVAFYIRRQVMKEIVNEQRREWFCRFPIDMYISKMGPWYATRRDIVGHLDTGRVGSV